MKHLGFFLIYYLIKTNDLISCFSIFQFCTVRNKHNKISPTIHYELIYPAQARETNQYLSAVLFIYFFTVYYYIRIKNSYNMNATNT